MHSSWGLVTKFLPIFYVVFPFFIILKALWDKAIEFRFLLQKVFSNSNRLPQEPVRSLFCDSHEGVSAAYSDLVDSSKRTLDSLAELQEALVGKNPSSIVQATDSKSEQSKKSQSSKNIDSDGDVMRIGHGFLSCCRE